MWFWILVAAWIVFWIVEYVKFVTSPRVKVDHNYADIHDGNEFM